MISSTQGFTLVEMLLSMAVIIILTAITVPVYETFVRRNDLDLNTQTTVDTIRKAETYARGVRNDSVWGVNFTASTMTLFKGSTYASRDTTFDEVTNLPSSVTQSGLTEVTFSKVFGVPSTTGTLTLSSTANSSKQVILNSEGSVDF